MVEENIKKILGGEKRFRKGLGVISVVLARRSASHRCKWFVAALCVQKSDDVSFQLIIRGHVFWPPPSQESQRKNICGPRSCGFLKFDPVFEKWMQKSPARLRLLR